MITYEAPPAAGELKPVDSNVYGILHESAGKMDLQSPPGKRDSFGVGDDSSSDVGASKDMNDVLYAGDDLNSDHALSSDNHSKPRPPDEASETLGLGGEFQTISSAQSLSTATQTHEVRMPMYLPTFKPATGCTNASDFIVRCFVARLRSGIMVVKHGRLR